MPYIIRLYQRDDKVNRLSDGEMSCEEKIAHSGWEYVVSNFNNTEIFNRWITTLDSLVKIKL